MFGNLQRQFCANFWRVWKVCCNWEYMLKETATIYEFLKLYVFCIIQCDAFCWLTLHECWKFVLYISTRWKNKKTWYVISWTAWQVCCNWENMLKEISTLYEVLKLYVFCTIQCDAFCWVTLHSCWKCFINIHKVEE